MAVGPATLYYSIAVKGDGAIGYWRLNGDANDSYGNNPHNGTVNDNITFGAAGPVPDFDGNATAALFASSVNGISLLTATTTPILNPFSFEAWVYYTDVAPADYHTIVCIRTGATMLVVTTARKLQFSILLTSGAQNITGTATIALNTWTHVAGTWNGIDTINMYVNGVLDKQTIVTPTTLNTVFATRLIGQDGNANANRSWAGRLYGVALYNYDLSAQQIATHYSLTTPINVIAPSAIVTNGGVQPISNPVPVIPPLGNKVTYERPDGANFIIAVVDDDYLGGTTWDNSGTATPIDTMNDPFFNPDESIGDGMRCDDDEDEDEDDDEFINFDTVNRPN